MDNQNPSPVNVTISGNDSLAVTTVAAVVRDAVSNAGFSNVSAFSIEGAHDTRGLDSGSLLDRVRRERPQLLDSPVGIQYLTNDAPMVDERDDLLADAPSNALSPAQEEEVEMDVAQEMAHEVTGNVGAVDGDPVAADPDSP